MELHYFTTKCIVYFMTAPMYYQAQSNAEMTQKLAVYGSLTLYMDFINIFIFLLQLLGVRKND